MDSNGIVDPTRYRTDSIWRVTASDVTVRGVAHVTQLSSGESLTITDRLQMDIVYLPNNDIAILEESGDEITPPWITLPVTSHATITFSIDTTYNTHDGMFHVKGQYETRYNGTVVVMVGGKSLNGVNLTTTSTATMDRSGDTGRFTHTQTWTYIPFIGFFTYITDLQTGTDVDGHREFNSDRMNLDRYELK